MNKSKFNTKSIFPIIGILILIALQFAANRIVPFMMDDLWYSTNLVTGDKLSGFGDVIESQIWHFNNWGGRSITHGLLQLVLMTGELWADILNTFVTVLLSFTVCVLIDEISPLSFFLVHSFIVLFNPNIQMSMFWEAGSVNYVYSTTWILVFMWLYISAIEGKERKNILLSVLIVPLGLISGWSNENMGPASCLLALCCTVYHLFIKKNKFKIWMILGCISSFVGGVLVVIAPGNFVRSAEIEKISLAQTILDRFYSMLRAGMEYLPIVVLITAMTVIVNCSLLKNKLTTRQWILIVFAVISYGAMVLSPHYPDRATFGTMVVLIGALVSMLANLFKNNSLNGVKWLLCGLTFVLTVIKLIAIYQ